MDGSIKRIQRAGVYVRVKCVRASVSVTRMHLLSVVPHIKGNFFVNLLSGPPKWLLCKNYKHQCGTNNMNEKNGVGYSALATDLAEPTSPPPGAALEPPRAPPRIISANPPKSWKLLQSCSSWQSRLHPRMLPLDTVPMYFAIRPPSTCSVLINGLTEAGGVEGGLRALRGGEGEGRFSKCYTFEKLSVGALTPFFVLLA
jgi:hypothetical protein